MDLKTKKKYRMTKEASDNKKIQPKTSGSYEKGKETNYTPREYKKLNSRVKNISHLNTSF
jgi:hypothetical protein